jgi:hypothetical protein
VLVQEVRWVECGSQPADNYTSFCGSGIANHCLGKGFFVHKGIISAVTGVQFIRYRTFRGDIIVLYVHPQTEVKNYDTKDSLYKELECKFSQLPKYKMKSLLEDFSAK